MAKKTYCYLQNSIVLFNCKDIDIGHWLLLSVPEVSVLILVLQIPKTFLMDFLQADNWRMHVELTPQKSSLIFSASLPTQSFF